MELKHLKYRICILRTKVWMKPFYQELSKEFLDEVDNYVRVANLGVRKGNDKWTLTSKKAVTMFLLRWQ